MMQIYRNLNILNKDTFLSQRRYQFKYNFTIIHKIIIVFTMRTKFEDETKRKTKKWTVHVSDLLQWGVAWGPQPRPRQHLVRRQVIWRMSCRAVIAEREVIHAHALAGLLRLIASSQFSQTHRAFAGIGRVLMDLFQTMALLYRKCNLSMDTWNLLFLTSL